MKHFYLTALSISMALTASAVSFPGTGMTPSSSKIGHRNAETSVIGNVLHLSTDYVKANSLTRAEGNESLTGEWTFTFGDYYFENSAGEIEINYEVQYEPTQDLYLFFSDNENGLPLAAFYDESTHVFTFPGVNWGENGGYYAFQLPYHYNAEENTLDYLEAIYGQYDPATGKMTFAADEGISWEAFNDADGSDWEGYYRIYDFLGATNLNAGVEGIEAELSGDVVYFDILGKKVNNPQKGQIVIRKQGKVSKKVIF